MNSSSPSARFRLWRWSSYCALAALLALAAGSNALNHRSLRGALINNAALWRPRLATPSIVALDSPADRTFTAEVKADAKACGWSASIANDLKTWPCKVVSATYATIDNGSQPGWQIRISVPPDTSPELFALTVACDEFTATRVQAVSVITDFAMDFYILHLSDEQIVNQFHTDPSGQYYKMVGTWEELKWMQQPINLINPRFCLVTGDQIDFNGALDGWNNWANWGYKPNGKKIFSSEETSNLELRLSAMYKDCHKGYHVPYVETPGNHDVTPPGKLLSGSHIDWHPISASIYEQQFGQRSYSFRMGDFYVLMHDWSDAALQEWASNDYEATFNDSTIKYRLIGQHYHAKWDGAPTGNYAFTPTNCDLMLIGHGHRTMTVQTSPYFIYMDGATFFWGRSGFFNFRRANDGWTCDETQGPRDGKKDVWGLFTDNGAVRKVRADQPDTRYITRNYVTITNDLPEEFYDGRVRFVLPKGKYDQAINGTILAEYDCLNNTKTAVLVKVDIPANGTITVSIPSAEAMVGTVPFASGAATAVRAASSGAISRSDVGSWVPSAELSSDAGILRERFTASMRDLKITHTLHESSKSPQVLDCGGCDAALGGQYDAEQQIQFGERESLPPHSVSDVIRQISKELNTASALSNHLTIIPLVVAVQTAPEGEGSEGEFAVRHSSRSIPNYPEGISGNSPAFQRRDKGTCEISPEGTADILLSERPNRSKASPIL